MICKCIILQYSSDSFNFHHEYLKSEFEPQPD